MTTPSVCSVNYIDHVGIAVKDIEEVLEFFNRVFGAAKSEVELLPDQGVRATLIEVGQTRLELLEPLTGDSPVDLRRDFRGPAPANRPAIARAVSRVKR